MKRRVKGTKQWTILAKKFNCGQTFAPNDSENIRNFWAGPWINKSNWRIELMSCFNNICSEPTKRLLKGAQKREECIRKLKFNHCFSRSVKKEPYQEKKRNIFEWKPCGIQYLLCYLGTCWLLEVTIASHCRHKHGHIWNHLRQQRLGYTPKVPSICAHKLQTYKFEMA